MKKVIEEHILRIFVELNDNIIEMSPIFEMENYTREKEMKKTYVYSYGL